MEIINFKKSATRRIGSFYSLKHYPNQINLKKYHQNQMSLKKPLMIQVRKNRSLKKHQVMLKKTTTKARKKVKKTSQTKKAPKSPEFLDTD